MEGRVTPDRRTRRCWCGPAALVLAGAVTLAACSGGSGSSAGSSGSSSVGTSGTSTPVSGTYSGGTQGTPHYYLVVRSSAAGRLDGSVNFAFQDGKTAVVLAFTGTVRDGSATLHPTDFLPNAGSATQARASVPTSLTATVGRDTVILVGCTTYLHFATSPTVCTFTLTPSGA